MYNSHFTGISVMTIIAKVFKRMMKNLEGEFEKVKQKDQNLVTLTINSDIS